MSLARLLTSLDGAGYGAYKKLHGSYELGEYRLRVDKVQSDPFAPPSLMQVDVPNPVPAELAGVAARDFLTRRIAQAFSGDRDLHIDQPGQQVLDRASVVLADDAGAGSGTRSNTATLRIEVRNYRTNGVTPTRPQDMRDVVYDGSVSHRMDRHHLAAGVEARRETLVNAGLRNGRDSADHRALFLQDEISLGTSLMATLGVRVDHHEIFHNETSPRAYLVWQATPELNIKGGYGEAFKAPTLKQISSNYVGAEGPHTFYGNDNIRPETSRSFELAADYRVGPLSLRGTLFQNKVKDLIYLRLLRQQGIRNFYQYDNVNRARIRGAELGLGWDITPNLHWNNDVTLLHARDGNGAELVNRPRSVVHSRLHWEAPRDFDLRLGAHYTGRQRVSDNTRLPGYTLTDASIGQKINPHVSWRVGLDNLGNLRLAEKSPDFGYAIRGRTWFTQLQIEF